MRRATKRADVGIGPYGGQEADADLDFAKPVPARKRFRTEIGAGAIRKQGANMHYLIRGAGGLRFGRRHARARIPTAERKNYFVTLLKFLKL